MIKRIKVSIFLLIIVLITAGIYYLYNKPFICDEEGNIVRLCIQPEQGLKYTLYISVDNKGVLYYKVGTTENSKLINNIKAMRLSKDFIAKPVAEDKLQLSKAQYRKLVRLCRTAGRENMPREKLDVLVLDGVLKYFWLNGNFYDPSGLTVNEGLCYEAYKEMESYLFDNALMPEDIHEAICEELEIYSYEEFLLRKNCA